MKIIDTLKKLGIFRFGSVSGTYKNGAERPTEFMMDGVMNAKTDLIGKGKFKKMLRIFYYLFVGIIIISFLQGILSKPSTDMTAEEALIASGGEEPTVINKDSTTLLLEEIAKVGGVDEYLVEEDSTLWTSKNINVQRTSTKSLGSEDIDLDSVKSFFAKEGWTTNVIGFNYVEKNNMGGIGYIAPMGEEYKYKAAMCIILESQNKISCGWGPGAN